MLLQPDIVRLTVWQRDDAIIRSGRTRNKKGYRVDSAAYGFWEAVKLAQMSRGNIAAFINAQNYGFLCAGNSCTSEISSIH